MSDDHIEVETWIHGERRYRATDSQQEYCGDIGLRQMVADGVINPGQARALQAKCVNVQVVKVRRDR